MMHTINSIAIQGLSWQKIDVEVDIATGIPAFTIVWLGDTAVQESKERVRSALKNSGYGFPSKRITVNLAPADTRKFGPSFDLPMALGILLGEWILEYSKIERGYFIGELALNWQLRQVNGILPAALFAKNTGAEYLVIPKGNLDEVSIIDGIRIYWADTLSEIVGYLEGKVNLTWATKRTQIKRRKVLNDFCDIRGQERIKRALTIAAAGWHNILMEWPPGSWKTLLAKAFEWILPDMTFDEIIEVSKIYSVAGLLSKKYPLIEERPFRHIHHTASAISIIGGWRTSRPGEVSLAHRWVLFLDEFLEFESTLLEMLRQPLEDGNVTVTRVHASYTYPANFLLIWAMNPCPCGYLWDSEKWCVCSAREIERYRSKLSGPIVDRIDLFVRVPRIRVEELEKTPKWQKSSSDIRIEVEAMRKIARKRFEKMKKFSNSEMTASDIDELANLSSDASSVLSDAVKKLSLSARAYFRIIRVARTIADLDGSDNIAPHHIAEALSYREP